MHDAFVRYCTAIEMDDDRCAKLKTNLRTLKLEARVTVVRGDYTEVRHFLAQDCTFFDPPYVFV